MIRIKRSAAAVGAATLLAFSLTACGGAPTDASEDDFCEVATQEPDDVDAIHDWADEAEEVGTPEDIPDDARAGFEAIVELAKDIEEEDLEDENFLDDLSEEEQDEFEAYATYVGETCGGPEVPDPEAT
ncbi:hypothetical protein [Nocardioides antri]|uniref:Lipoprotein n=1 Tax=Nocardioides antri TaxID=2607659 RepID=A0A5B1M555_9ACTN|nr:hypothetical protein [Nocardioides antri]KAA1427911.1 hypothetical protein F0U47_10900 [Nocardioides antri]